MYKKIVFLLVLIPSIVIFTLPAQAMMCWDDMVGMFGGKNHMNNEETQKQAYQKPMGSLEGRFYVDLKDELALTNAQVKALDELGREYENKKSKKVSTVDKRESELAMLQTKRNVDMDEIKKKVDEIENLRKEMRLNYVNTNEQAKKLLTDEQLDRLSKISKGDAAKMEQGVDRGSMSEKKQEGTTMEHGGMGSHGGM